MYTVVLLLKYILSRGHPQWKGHKINGSQYCMELMAANIGNACDVQGQKSQRRALHWYLS